MNRSAKFRKSRAVAAASAVAVLALAATGCVSVFPSTSAIPMFAVPDPPPPVVADGGRSAPTGIEGAALEEAIGIGRVRVAQGASGRALRAEDVASGRLAFYTGGDLACAPEALVARRLRKAAAAMYPGAVVCDSSVAPRGVRATVFECWVEDFRLERDGDAWRFMTSGAVYRTAGASGSAGAGVASGSPAIVSSPFEAVVPVEAIGSGQPSPTAVAAAISRALGAIVPQ